jgi:hypothetical protein
MMRPLLALLRACSAAAPLALCLASAGCADLIAGKHETEARFTVGPVGDGSFYGWSEITVSEDPNDAGRATIFAATMELEDPSQATDMTFILSVSGEAVTSTERTLVVQKSPVPPNETLVEFDILHHDDIRPFFEDRTVRFEWKGQTNPAFTAWPEGGIGVKVKVGVEIE